MIQKRTFFRLNKEIGAIGLGCFPLGGPFYRANGNVLGYGQVDDEMSKKVIKKAIDLGINIFDTADVYGTGRSEVVLGEAIKDYRDNVIIATKFGSCFEEGTGRDLSKKDISPEYIKNAVEGSLRRLQTDYIDIYQIHGGTDDIALTPDSKAHLAQQALEELVEQGIIRSYGWSTDDPANANLFVQNQNFSAVQFILNVTYKNEDIIKLIEKNKMNGLIKAPLGYGSLTGKYNSESKIDKNHLLSNWDFSTERRKNIYASVIRAKKLFFEEGKTLVQGLLHWILQQSPNVIPIPGAKTLEQLEENSEVLTQKPLSQDCLKQIDKIFIDSRLP